MRKVRSAESIKEEHSEESEEESNSRNITLKPRSVSKSNIRSKDGDDAADLFGLSFSQESKQGYARFKYRRNLELFETLPCVAPTRPVNKILLRIPKPISALYGAILEGSRLQENDLHELQQDLHLQYKGTRDMIQRLQEEDLDPLEERKRNLQDTILTLTENLQRLSQPISQCEEEHEKIAESLQGTTNHLNLLAHHLNTVLQPKLSDIKTRVHQVSTSRNGQSGMVEFGWMILAIALNLVANVLWWCLVTIRSIRGLVPSKIRRQGMETPSLAAPSGSLPALRRRSVSGSAVLFQSSNGSVHQSHGQLMAGDEERKHYR